MSKEFVPAPPDDPMWNTSYSVGMLEATEEPSKEITAAIAEHPAADRFVFYRGGIMGFQGYTDWPTASWIEVAHDMETGDYRILWKSGIKDTLEIPAAALTEWGNAKDAQTALDRLYEDMEKSGRPMIGVCSVERIQEADGRWRERPKVFGFEFGDLP
ncbi:hypothetical protein J2X76_003699 [Neorhizobium sp. 2083]|uniref:hypothetical protein n=1 Tax=Neorhizobium sp. 2083 TaxID=2817762 RepID=UPI0028631D00|nr:hypothetical protein [Neorhizobium sp. 2083]MDR6818522.1 hypothetical protein [Neorhizobium sp. 2083]